MTTILQHAKRELRDAGLFNDDSDYNGEIGVQVTALVETLGAYSHSGGSLERTLEVFDRVAHHLPILPLTGDDSEWEIPRGTSGQIAQNVRCSRVFKDDTMAWDVKHGRKPITFPYTPQ